MAGHTGCWYTVHWHVYGWCAKKISWNSQWDFEATSIRVLVTETSSTKKHLETVVRVPPTLFNGQAVQKRHSSESWTSKIDRKTPQWWQFTGRDGDKSTPDSWCQRAKETCQNEGDSQIRTRTDQEHKVRIFGQHICSLVWQLKICTVSTSASRCKEKYCVSDFIKSQINDWRSFVFFFSFRQTTLWQSVSGGNTRSGEASHPQAGCFVVGWRLWPQVFCLTST